MSWFDDIKARVIGQKILSLSFSATEGDDEWKIIGMLLEIGEEGSINVENKWELLSLGQMEEWLQSHQYLPLILGVDSNEVLMRKVEGQESAKRELLQSIVPQAQPEDFFLQALQEPDHSFVAIIRKESWQRILDLIPKKNVIVGVFLGPLAKAILAKGLSATEVSLGELQITKNGSVVERIVPLAIEEIDGELRDSGIENKDVLAYAVGIGYLSGLSIINDFQVKVQEEELFHQVFFHRLAKYVLGFVLVLFLANTLLFLELSKDNDQWQDQISSFNSTQKKVQEYYTFVEKHRDLIDGLNKTYYTQLADELGASVPSGISLQEVEIMPLSLQEKGAPEEDRRVLISGTAVNASVYTQWIETIKAFAWAQGIDKNTYRAVPRSKVGFFQLEILIAANV